MGSEEKAAGKGRGSQERALQKNVLLSTTKTQGTHTRKVTIIHPLIEYVCISQYAQCVFSTKEEGASNGNKSKRAESQEVVVPLQSHTQFESTLAFSADLKVSKLALCDTSIQHTTNFVIP